ncbi:hypothetical protein FGO68_gene17009 [Halteria grandinella]|uniref:Uncharacterized protein n=1 Tax=Halteria grandinella TaxID=5974 RepID=A0A8J8ND21_HALGN|nr:hypothetical protein FGO68_gene17009 [Halteria grandinella]
MAQQHPPPSYPIQHQAPLHTYGYSHSMEEDEPRSLLTTPVYQQPLYNDHEVIKVQVPQAFMENIPLKKEKSEPAQPRLEYNKSSPTDQQQPYSQQRPTAQSKDVSMYQLVMQEREDEFFVISREKA